MQWCQRARRAWRINTSVELWDPYGTAEDKHPDGKNALLASHTNLVRRLIAGWKEPGPTRYVLEHGANPGLISHFTQAGPVGHRRTGVCREEVRRRTGGEGCPPRRKIGPSNHLAHLLGVKAVIHCSERGYTASRNRPKPGRRIRSITWSVEGFRRRRHHDCRDGQGQRTRKNFRLLPSSTLKVRRVRSARPVWA